MKLPSFRQVVQEARATARRFPIVICVAAVGTGAALVLADYEGPPGPTILFNILLAGILGIPLLTALALVAERRRLGRPAALGVHMAGVLLLAGYALTVPTDLSHAPSVTLFQFFVLAVGLHLFVAVAPFATRGELTGFWHYNKSLFLRLLTAVLFGLVLYAGLSIALAALENLFGIDVPEKRYFQLWILINGVFITWFFLAGVPEDLAQLDTLTDYPKGLKVFAQNILVPIVFIYLVILYAYLAKILFAWDWPQGWVSKLILGFSGTGIFSLLLLHPLTGRGENIWLAKTARWFYVVLIPLVVMLFLAVWRRVSEYGITEGRYLAIALGVWLLFLIVYFTLSRTKSIKFIPASLCLLVFVVSFGPWGTFSVARESQIGRLERIATRAGILAEGRIRPAPGEVPFQDARQISAILNYLHEMHGFSRIQGWFEESLRDDSVRSGVAYKSPEIVAGMMGLEYVARWRATPGGLVTLEAEGACDLTGYDRMVQMPVLSGGGETGELPAEGITYRVTEGMERMIFTATGTGAELLQVDLREHAERLLKEYGSSATGRVPVDSMAVRATGTGLRVRICPWQIQMQQRDGETELIRIRAALLFFVAKAP